MRNPQNKGALSLKRLHNAAIQRGVGRLCWLSCANTGESDPGKRILNSYLKKYSSQSGSTHTPSATPPSNRRTQPGSQRAVSCEVGDPSAASLLAGHLSPLRVEGGKRFDFGGRCACWNLCEFFSLRSGLGPLPERGASCTPSCLEINLGRDVTGSDMRRGGGGIRGMACRVGIALGTK